MANKWPIRPQTATFISVKPELVVATAGLRWVQQVLEISIRCNNDAGSRSIWKVIGRGQPGSERTVTPENVGRLIPPDAPSYGLACRHQVVRDECSAIVVIQPAKIDRSSNDFKPHPVRLSAELSHVIAKSGAIVGKGLCKQVIAN